MSSPAGSSFKKRFGQHFLRDTGTLNRIVRFIDPSGTDMFLEIGAGDGALSARLAPLVMRLLAVERDPDWLPALEDALSPYPAATVVPGDILEMDIRGLFDPYVGRARLRAAGNLPYNIATAVIGSLLTLRLPLADMTFMVQLEVAQRITASPGSREYGLLSVWCQHLSQVVLAFTVSPACFVPRPQVTSAVVRFKPFERRWDQALEDRLLGVLKAAFAYRRKNIANSLRRNPEYGGISDHLLEKAGIEGTRRAEDLSVQEFESLARHSTSLVPLH